MNKLISRFPMTLLILLILTLGSVPAAFAQEPGADLALTKTTDRKNVKIVENIILSVNIHIIGNTN